MRLGSFLSDGRTTSVPRVVPRSKAFGHLEAEDETADAFRVAVAEFKSRHVHHSLDFKFGGLYGIFCTWPGQNRREFASRKRLDRRPHSVGFVALNCIADNGFQTTVNDNGRKHGPWIQIPITQNKGLRSIT